MQQYNKLTAAAVAGALITIISAIIDAGGAGEFMKSIWSTNVQGAVQTLVTAFVVFIAPANVPPPPAPTPGC